MEVSFSLAYPVIKHLKQIKILIIQPETLKGPILVKVYSQCIYIYIVYI